jgi:2-(1,2-epoxy-1,2-dihydrophenyl)acetyl-CoA isomerase
MTQDPPVIVERAGGLVVVRLNRPAALNAISAGCLEIFDRDLTPLTRDPEVRAILITGEGRAFCAGGDLGDVGGEGPRNREQAAAGMRRAHQSLKALRASHAVTVAAVNGPAAGAGFGLAMLADVVVASEGAFFKAGFNDLGVAPDYGLAYTLPRIVGEPRAFEILFSDRRVPAAEAHQLGMAARLLPAEGFAEAAREFARTLAAGPFAARIAKRLIRLGDEAAFARFLDAEADAQAEAFQSEDFREGLRAFAERRAAAVQGR